MNKSDHTEEIGKQAASLSLIEIGIGSLLHSFKIPFAGHWLSINQIALLSRSSFKLKSIKAALQISVVAALLKSLSPAGKKLTPMLAITTQGVFYYLGLFFFGVNHIGLIVAVLLSSLWAFVQPVMFIYLLFGKTSIEVAEYFLKEFGKLIPNAEHILLWLLIGLIILKFILAFGLSLFAIKMSDVEFENYQKKMILEIKSKPSSNHSPVFMALKDLWNPLFIISFILTALFFLFSQSLSMSQIIWFLLRPLAIGFIIFYIIRVYPAQKLSSFLQRKGCTQLGKILDTAIKIVHQGRE